MLPPVMGVAAFLMADIVADTTYLGVVQAGTIPAALFYVSVFVGIHFLILKHGWTTDNLSAFNWRVLKRGGSFAPPLAVLLYTLVIAGYTPMTAGLYTIATLLVTMIVRNLWRRTDSGAGDQGAGSIARQTASGLEQGGTEMAPLVGVLSAMGLIIELLNSSGLTGRLGAEIISYADVTVSVLDEDDPITGSLAPDTRVWASHADEVTELPGGFELTAESDVCDVEAMSDTDRELYGVQWHPEVAHTERGEEVFENFLSLCERSTAAEVA